MSVRPSVARRLRRLTAALLLSAACLTPATEARADAEVLRLYQETNAAFRRGDYRLAEITARAAVDRATEVLGEHHPDTLTCLNNYALVLNTLGRPAEAEPLFKRILDIRNIIQGERHSHTLISLNNFALVLVTLGRAAEAEPLYERAIYLQTEELGERHPYTLTTLYNYAVALEFLGRLPEAESSHKRTLNLRTEVLGERHPDTLASLSSYAFVLKNQNRATEAEPLLKLAFDLRTEVLGERHPDTLLSLNNYTGVLYSLERIEEAELLIKRSLDLNRSVLGERHPITLLAATNYSVILLRLNRTDEALERLAWGIDRLHDWSGGEMHAMSRDAGRRELALRNSSRISAILSVALQRPSPRSVDLAAQTVLRWKQRTTEEDALLERLIRRSDEPEIRRQAESVAGLRRDVAALARKDDKAYAPTAEKLDAALRDLRQTLRDPAFLTTAQTATPAAVAGRLPDGAALVEFRLYNPFNFATAEFAPQRLAAMVLERNRPPLIYDAGAVTDLNKLIGPATGGDKTAASELFKLAFGPAAERLKAVKTVFIAPDGPLWDVAPAVLRAGPAADYWLKDKSLRIIATGRDLPAPAFTPAAGGLVVVGDVNYGEVTTDGRIEKAALDRYGDAPATLLRAAPGLTPLVRLDHSKREASFIKEFYDEGPGSNAVLLLDGAKATEAALKRLTKPPKVLHLATHGDYRAVDKIPDRPEVMSWVALAGANRGMRGEVDADGEDGLLTALEAAALPLEGTSLVVLSACKTGDGGKDYSEGLIGLARAFRIAGARHVLAALRNVDDELTADLMIEFHRTWLAGGMKDPHEALRKVQISFADDPDPRKSAPGFWGAFVVIGP
jgi:CHAT domain-containing protein